MKIEPVKNKKRGAYLEYYYYSDWHLFLWSKWLYRSFDHDFYIFFRQNELQINFGWRQNSLFLRSAGSVLKMSLILFLARGSSATNWKTSNIQFTTRSSPFFRALHPVFWKCSTANSGAKHRSHIFVFVKSSWSANNRNELQVTKLAW